MPIVKVAAYQCSRCGHVWLPKPPERTYKRCPICRSPYWDKPRRQTAAKDGNGAVSAPVV